jgi:hypothetical protein
MFPFVPVVVVRPATTETQPSTILPPVVVAVDSVPHVPTPDRSSCNSSQSDLLLNSGDCGHVVDTVNPNGIEPVENSFSEIQESPAKQYTADAMEMLQLEKGVPTYGPHWALAKVAAFSAHRACDYFTDFGLLGCKNATKAWVVAMKTFFDESNHDINGNRIELAKDRVFGPLGKAVFNAYAVTIAAMGSKQTLAESRNAINEAAQIINAIAADQSEAEDYRKAEIALVKGCQSYEERDDGAFLRNLQGAKLNSLGLNAAVSALGLSSLAHAVNCYICNSFGSRIVIDAIVWMPVKEQKRSSRRLHSRPSIHFSSPEVF